MVAPSTEHPPCEVALVAFLTPLPGQQGDSSLLQGSGVGLACRPNVRLASHYNPTERAALGSSRNINHLSNKRPPETQVQFKRHTVPPPDFFMLALGTFLPSTNLSTEFGRRTSNINDSLQTAPQKAGMQASASDFHIGTVRAALAGLD